MALDFETEIAVSAEDQRWTFWGVVCLILILFVASVLFYTYWDERSPNLNTKLIVGIIATTAVLILSSTYFYAYRFFQDVFYLFISVGWLANAFYLPFEFFVPELKKTLQFELNVYYFSFVSSLPFFIAFLTLHNKSAKRSAWICFGWLIGLFTTSLLCHHIADSVIAQESASWKFAVITLPGVVFVIYIMTYMGIIFRRRLSYEVHGKAKLFLPLTFYGYAVLQLAYPFKLHLSAPNNKAILLSIFYVALLLKIGNNISLLGVLLSTVTYPQFVATQELLRRKEERLHERSQLEELGALASSIEHDIKTPLATMALNINTMKKRFQNNDEITVKLKKLEESRKRIAAIVRVISFLRGDRDFYARDRFMEKVNMVEVAHRAVKAVKIELKLDSKYNINIEGKDSWARAYSPMIEQVIVNVVKNGIEAINESRPTGGLITIRILPTSIPESEYSRWVKVEVSDNGCGIPADNIAKITTLFTTRADVKPNSGIGMFIGARMMKIHGGHINFTSKVDEGTTVTLLLPEWFAYQKAIKEKFKADKSPNDKASPDTSQVELIGEEL